MQLLTTLRDASLDQAIVFTSTKRGADDLADRLADQGFAAAAPARRHEPAPAHPHPDATAARPAAHPGGHRRAAVASTQGISHAVNFDLPMQAEDYVHRIGRTGRAGRNGLAHAGHAPERHKVRRIEHYIGQSITPEVIAGLEPQRTPRPSTGGRAAASPSAASRRWLPGQPRRLPATAKRVRRALFGDRPAFGDRPQRRLPRRALFGDRPQREGGFHGKPSFGDRPQRVSRRAPRRSPATRSGFRGGDRPYGDRPQREGGFRASPRSATVRNAKAASVARTLYGDCPSFRRPRLSAIRVVQRARPA